MMVGRRSFPFGGWPIFWGELLEVAYFIQRSHLSRAWVSVSVMNLGKLHGNSMNICVGPTHRVLNVWKNYTNNTNTILLSNNKE